MMIICVYDRHDIRWWLYVYITDMISDDDYMCIWQTWYQMMIICVYNRHDIRWWLYVYITDMILDDDYMCI